MASSSALPRAIFYVPLLGAVVVVLMVIVKVFGGLGANRRQRDIRRFAQSMQLEFTPREIPSKLALLANPAVSDGEMIINARNEVQGTHIPDPIDDNGEIRPFAQLGPIKMYNSEMYNSGALNIARGNYRDRSTTFFDLHISDGQSVTSEGSAVLVKIDKDLPAFHIRSRYHVLSIGESRLETGVPDFDKHYFAYGDTRFLKNLLSPKVIDSLSWGSELVADIHMAQGSLVVTSRKRVPPTMLLPFFDLASELTNSLLSAPVDPGIETEPPKFVI